MRRIAVLLCLALSVAPHALAAQARPPSAVPDELTLSPGDVIEMTVWREKDLTGEFIVDESGSVVLPLLGPRHVTGIPIGELRDQLLRDYRVELQNPSINIRPLRRIYVLGEVNKPGLYTVDPTVSLAGAIALAEGATGAGDLGKIRIFRNGQQIMSGAPVQTMLQSGDIRSGDQIFVGERSWFVRNSTFVVSMLFSVSSILITILRR